MEDDGRVSHFVRNFRGPGTGRVVNLSLSSWCERPIRSRATQTRQGRRQISSRSLAERQHARHRQNGNGNTSNLPESRIFVQNYRIYQKNKVIHLSRSSHRHDEKTEANRRKAGRKVIYLSFRCHRFVRQNSRFVPDFHEYTGKAPENSWQKSYFYPCLPAGLTQILRRTDGMKKVVILSGQRSSGMHIFVLCGVKEERTKTAQP